MSSGDIQVILAMALYFIVVLSVGFFYLRRSNSSSENYFLGGRGLGPWLTALSAEASGHVGLAAHGPAGRCLFLRVRPMPCGRQSAFAIGTYLELEVRGATPAQVF